MATIVDEYLDSQSTDNEDVFPCKGCGDILEEGKAFELAGNRWHLDCFRCNTCGTLLDSDANLLLLGDGSLICNNCTYSCSACNNKIEDLAILTGDQAFCSTCFRCRNCKRKIDNLRYARTSQGIFCMSCHETLMARRRKKSKAAAAAKSRDRESSPMITEKSLPALPPNVIPNGAFSDERVDPESDTPTELSPRPRQGPLQREPSSRSTSRPAARSPERPSKPEGLGLTQPPQRSNRNSTMLSNEVGGDDDFFIPVALDPSPGPSANSRSGSGNAGEASKKKDYFSIPKSSFSDKSSRASTPHIAFQDKGRQSSVDQIAPPAGTLTRNLSKQSAYEESSSTDERASRAPPRTRPSQGSDEFKLQEAPKRRPPFTSSTSSPAVESPLGTSNSAHNTREQLPLSESRKNSESLIPRKSQDSRRNDHEDGRQSLDSSSRSAGQQQKAIPRKEVGSNKEVGSSGVKTPPTQHAEEPNRQARATPADQPRSNGSYMHPRSAPAPPPPQLKENQEDDGSPKPSPKLPRWSSGGDFTMDEDMARILGTDEGSSYLLRRSSNIVRHGRTNSVESGARAPSRISHGRSISETTRLSGSPQWRRKHSVEERNRRTPDLMSPPTHSPADDPAILKRQLRTSEQRIAELEKQSHSEKDLKNLNKKLIEKRKTVSVLDTQTEVMIQQLEVLAGYVEKSKETKTPVDPRELEDSAIRDFVQKLENVKMSMSESIEQLHEQRDRLEEEKLQAMADRDRALMEFEQLSSKNAQLADMNNDLTHQLQERMKNAGDGRSLNGLGIYEKGASSVNLDSSSSVTGPTLIATDDDHILEHGPTVVQVRKGQVKKFNWKKGSKGLAQGVAKGVNRAVVAFQQNDRGERVPTSTLQGGDIGMPYATTVTSLESPGSADPYGQPNRLQAEPSRQGFGFFSKKHTMPKSQSASAVSTPAVPDASITLFGSDLTERAEFERRQIPSVVTRCIEEVELRGMDQEGIYRKTGGNSQINMIKDGFDKNESFDISDPDLDITAVTSVLKQYFRKLPVPLLSYDVYDRVLESTSIVDETERCDHLRRTFQSLPEHHRDCLEFLMFHLDRVAQREKENLMTPKNLAVVFAPTIMFDRSIEREMTDMHAKNLAVQFVIENSRNIFAEA